ncbi:MAG: hypothetical protein NC395_04100 [Prevotella sp.]|nr:hypothetical protein [Prevotella sp.]
MPKMRMKASEEEKIRRLKQDIKDMKLDMKETFSVMETMEKPKKRSGRPILFIGLAAAVTAAALAAAVLAAYLIIAH